MSDARPDTAEDRAHDAAAPGAGHGRHRGPASPRDTEGGVSGRHRRPAQAPQEG